MATLQQQIVEKFLTKLAESEGGGGDQRVDVKSGLDSPEGARDARRSPVNLARVVVVGTSCSGKTTFAHRLASSLNTEWIELDALYWGPGWTPRPTFEGDVRAAAQQSRWVIDGNYSRVRDIIWRRCTAIAWLDYSFARVFSRAFRRTVRRIVSGERLYGGNRETARETLFDVETPLWLVVRTHGRRRREFPELFNRPEYRHARVIRLNTPAAADRFLAEASERRSPSD